MSNNLNLDQVAASQAQKEITINAQAGQLDAAITETFTADVSSGNVALTDSQFRRAVHFRVSGAATSGRELQVPAIKHLFMVTADAGNSDPIIVDRGSTQFSMVAGTTSLFYTDGTTNGLVQVAGGGGGGTPQYGATYRGTIPSAEILLEFIMTEDASLPEDLTGSRGYAGTAPASDADFDIQKNDVSVGTMSFATSSQTATFVMASATSFSAGDRLTIVAPNPADANLADVTFTLRGG